MSVHDIETASINVVRELVSPDPMSIAPLYPQCTDTMDIAGALERQHPRRDIVGGHHRNRSPAPQTTHPADRVGGAPPTNWATHWISIATDRDTTRCFTVAGPPPRVLCGFQGRLPPRYREYPCGESIECVGQPPAPKSERGCWRGTDVGPHPEQCREIVRMQPIVKALPHANTHLQPEIEVSILIRRTSGSKVLEDRERVTTRPRPVERDKESTPSAVSAAPP
jgi:hypothetical protein